MRTWAITASQCSSISHGKIATPDITQTERFGAVKYGFGLNTEQEVTDSLRLFARFGWNEDQHESFAYTEVGQTILFGGDYSGHSWHGRTTRSAWRLSRTPSSATTRIICTMADSAFCWATET